MASQLGEVIAQTRRMRKLTLRQLAQKVAKDDGTSICPQYLNDIEVHHRIPAPHLLSEPAWVLELDYDTLLALAGTADTVVR